MLSINKNINKSQEGKKDDFALLNKNRLMFFNNKNVLIGIKIRVTQIKVGVESIRKINKLSKRKKRKKKNGQEQKF